MNPLTQTFELVKKAQAGDRDALDRLFARYYERARRSVRARLGPRLRGHLDSGDILQAAFGKAFRIFDRFEMRHEGSFLNWIAEIATRQIKDQADYWDSDKRTPPSPLVHIDAEPAGQSGNLGDMVPGAETGPDGRSIKRERDARVDECLDLLTEEHRMVIVLRDYDGLQWREVAEKLGKNTESAARETHSRALLELTKQLKRRGIGPEEP